MYLVIVHLSKAECVYEKQREAKKQREGQRENPERQQIRFHLNWLSI